MYDVEFAGAHPSAAPGFQELPVLVQLDDPCDAGRRSAAIVTIRDEHVAIGSHRHIGWRIEKAVGGALLVLLAERQQDLALLIQLEHLRTGVVSNPEVSVRVDRHLVRSRENVGAEVLQEFSGRVELKDGGDALSRTVAGHASDGRNAATIDGPERATRRDRYAGCRAPHPAGRQLPPRDPVTIRIRQVVVNTCGGKGWKGNRVRPGRKDWLRGLLIGWQRRRRAAGVRGRWRRRH